MSEQPGLRTGFPDGASTADPRQSVLSTLHEHATRLAGDLPGLLGRLRVCSGDAVIEIEWLGPGSAPAPPGPTPHAGQAPVGGPEFAAWQGRQRRPAEPDEAGGQSPLVVTSPLVGTFYCAAEPGAEPFVTVGSAVEAGQTIGLVEAMKLLNPVTADISGTVARICVGNGDAVEYGQPLIKLAARQ